MNYNLDVQSGLFWSLWSAYSASIQYELVHFLLC